MQATAAYYEERVRGLGDEFRLHIDSKPWYIYDDDYGTDEEKYFVKFFNQIVDDLSLINS